MPSYTVLVVDYDANNRKIIRKFLQREGYLIMEAGDGLQALKMMQYVIPDVILLDFQMPQMNGLELLEVIRSKGLDTVVIFMTAFGSDMLNLEALDKEADEYLEKPLNFELLGKRIGIHLKRRKKRLEGIVREYAGLKVEKVFISLRTVPVLELGEMKAENRELLSGIVQGEEIQSGSSILVANFLNAIQDFGMSVFGERVAQISMGTLQILSKAQDELMLSLFVKTEEFVKYDQNGLLHFIERVANDLFSLIGPYLMERSPSLNSEALVTMTADFLIQQGIEIEGMS